MHPVHLYNRHIINKRTLPTMTKHQLLDQIIKQAQELKEAHSDELRLTPLADFQEIADKLDWAHTKFTANHRNK